jgi:iron complex transport system substrate-binding protein
MKSVFSSLILFSGLCLLTCFADFINPISFAYFVFVKMLWTYCCLLAFGLLLLACQKDQKSNTVQTDSNSNRYATGYDMKPTEYGYRIDVYRPWQNAKNEQFTYLLSRKPEDSMAISIPVKKVVCMSTTHIAYISELKEAGSVKGLSGTKYVYNADLQKQIESGETEEIGASGNLNSERIIEFQPDVLFAYAIQPSELRPLRQLEELGIPVVLVGDYLEQSPLGKLEWLRFFAAFYDKVPRADSLIDKRATVYQKLRQQIPKAKEPPSVLTNIPWQGVWWVPGGDSYLAALIEDAGGNYLFSDYKGTESHPVDIEQVFHRSENADIWIHTGNLNTCESVMASDRRLSMFHELEDIRIYNNNKRRSGPGNDFYESAVVHPEKVLADLRAIFYPNQFNCDSLTYYKPLCP